jgi:hypothetical protein
LIGSLGAELQSNWLKNDRIYTQDGAINTQNCVIWE